SLFNNFKSFIWSSTISQAKKDLDKTGKPIMPELIKMLNNNGFVKLVNTEYLMYPGSKEVKWSHGYFIYYDIDWLSIRAGWLLEELTFMDFGYCTKNYYDYGEMMRNQNDPFSSKKVWELKWEKKQTKEQVIKNRPILADKVKKWWTANGDKWNRIDAMKEALQSNDEYRVELVFKFLMRGECDELTKDVYVWEIRPIVEKLIKSPNSRIKLTAKAWLNNDWRLNEE
ncbi:MAG: hypothetical protein EAZ12_06880, partial [Sphingobacteriia bacterium]